MTSERVFHPGDQLRLLGLDVGDRRIGVAVSDPTGSITRPLEIYRRRSDEVDIRHMVDLADEYEAIGFVVGLPKNMNGTEGHQAEKTREFAEALMFLGRRVALWDERLSTIEAIRRRDEQRPKRRGSPERIDAEAAALILQTYLDHVRMRSGS